MTSFYFFFSLNIANLIQFRYTQIAVKTGNVLNQIAESKDPQVCRYFRQPGLQKGIYDGPVAIDD